MLYSAGFPDYGRTSAPGVGAWRLTAVTGAIAWHGIRYRDAEGNTDTVRLLFGCIAAVFFLMVLLQDVLGVVRFG